MSSSKEIREYLVQWKEWNRENGECDLNRYVDRFLEQSYDRPLLARSYLQYCEYLSRIYDMLGEPSKMKKLSHLIFGRHGEGFQDICEQAVRRQMIFSPAVVPTCIICGEERNVQTCTCNLEVYYCSEDCQSQDWKYHMKYCIMAREN
jgi:hypothetical protein